MSSSSVSAALAADSHAVFHEMASSDGILERHALLGDRMAMAIWRRDDEGETHYDHPGHHTLSYYLGGGYGAQRSELPGVYGAPERLCTLPDWHESRWRVRGPLRFLHVYFLPEHYTRRAVLELDREPRELTLADRTYFEDAQLGRMCAQLAAMPWEGPDARLRANELVHETLSQLLRTQSALLRGVRLRGGLAPVVRRRLADYIEVHLGEAITLGRLADLACLSEYHLARMFKVSFGMPPSAWIAARRIERARALLKTGSLTPTEIARACGYADPSHFSHRFRDSTGVAPGRYCSALSGV